MGRIFLPDAQSTTIFVQHNKLNRTINYIPVHCFICTLSLNVNRKHVVPALVRSTGHAKTGVQAKPFLSSPNSTWAENTLISLLNILIVACTAHNSYTCPSLYATPYEFVAALQTHSFNLFGGANSYLRLFLQTPGLKNLKKLYHPVICHTMFYLRMYIINISWFI